ncbi:CCR4-NOT transcription complex subunit 10 isoform X1 [Photinus pyralis]|uniref:CCR4-NOT transcription complex subunit 10 isoform X1 n=1 Tax=Photinus pyralis TaxID=7054 RepID=UPI001267140C|nr:CCR4-NOT transcription complex subunit 10 isoform X1 [Photinus pyralis]
MTEKEEEKSMDCVSDQEREIAQLALSEFQKGNYSACLQNIHKLEVRTFDLKVAHNKLVAEYYKNDLRSTETFQKNLAAFYSQFKLRLEKLDDVDHCVAHYNQAVLLYHQKQYTQAIRIMERVYKFIEPMDENLAQQVGLLLVELQMSTKQLDKASGLLSFLENQLFHSHPVILKQGEKPAKVIDKDKKMCTVSSTTIDQFKKKLQMYKARCFLMKHSLGAASEEIEKIEEQSEMTIAARFLRANLLYLQGNCEAAMEILNGISSEADFGSSDESYNVILYNNLGTIYHAMGKYHLACHHYQKAIKADIELIQSKSNEEKPLYRLGSSRYHELIYNLGISLLHAGRSADAFDCLIIAVRRYHRNSRLWLRLAECCIHVHKESNEIDFNIPKEMKVGVEMIGTKKHQKIVLTKNLSNDKKYSVEGEPYAVPVPTLEFASLCLRNAYLLLPSDTTSPIPLLLIPGVTPPAPPPSPGPAPSVPLSPNSVSALKNSILASSAYVCLCLGDYVLALEHARNLLSQSKLLGAHRLLGHLYAAEALVFLDKIADALEHLNPENVKDIALHFPVSEILDESDNVANNPPSKWFPTNLISARAVIHYNTAVCKTLRGQFDQADGLFKQIWKDCRSNSKVPARLIMLVIYIELQLGHPDVARSLIKEYS